jgi:tetratricopeptide (TPR) repeat protein
MPSESARREAALLERARLLRQRVDSTGDIHARASLTEIEAAILGLHERALEREAPDLALELLEIADLTLAATASATSRLERWEGAEARLGSIRGGAATTLDAGVGRALAGASKLPEAERRLRAAVDRALSAKDPRAKHLLVELGVVVHARGRLADARASYLRAVELDADRPDTRLAARAWGNLAAVLHDEGKLDAARRNYERSIALAAEVGDARIEGIMATNLGVLDLELGGLERAGLQLEGAQRLLEQAGDRRLAAIARSNLMTVELERGDLERACALGEGALVEQLAVGDLRSLTFLRARLAVTYALLGATQRATAEREHALAAARATGDSELVDLVSLAALFEAYAEDPVARESTLSAMRLLAGKDRRRGDEARALVRIAERAFRREAQPPADALLVSRDGRFFRVAGGAWRGLPADSPLRRIFEELVVRRERQAEGGVSAAELAALAWSPSAPASRVHASIAQLRDVGLADLLVRRPTGYQLDPERPVVRDDPPETVRARAELAERARRARGGGPSLGRARPASRRR